ncbi:MAG: tRNA isopentenyl-2-thiomethyl-A-37 hydroxylase MiaE [Myxococcota bacterium]
MLDLASETPPEWAARAVGSIDDVLLDHAHCERKAAGAAVRMLFRYPEQRFLQEPLSRLAREELVHFERVLGELDRRGVRFARQKPSAYGGRLHALVRASDPERLVDLLLISALIEARSCERFRLLADALADDPLGALYRDLVASEARHHRAYAKLAESAAGGAAEEVAARLRELASAEAEIVGAPSRAVRLHSS